MLKALYISLVVIFAACLVANIIARVKKGGKTALSLKATTSMLFVLLSIIAILIKPENFSFGICIVVGAFFGMLGDILLDLQSMYKEREQAYLIGGMASYAVGHILYAISILLCYPEYIPWQIILAVVCAAAVTIIVRISSVKLGFDFGRLSSLTFIYSIITMLTVTFSLNAMNAFGVLQMAAGEPMPQIMPRFVTMFIGTSMFAISDLVVSIIYFKEGGYKNRNIALNYSLYYTSQIILSLSILM